MNNHKQNSSIEDLFGPNNPGKKDEQPATPKEPSVISKEKQKLLDHYATGEPQEFLQIDVFDVPKEWTDDALMGRAAGGDFIISGIVTELRHTGHPLTVRLQIRRGTDNATVVRQVKKILLDLEGEFSLIPEKK